MRQVYAGLDIITNKASAAEQGGVPHHCLATVPPTRLFHVHDYLGWARQA